MKNKIKLSFSFNELLGLALVVATVSASLLCSEQAVANEKQNFYTIVDSSGRVINIPAENVSRSDTANTQTKKASATKQPVNTEPQSLAEQPVTQNLIEEQKVAQANSEIKPQAKPQTKPQQILTNQNEEKPQTNPHTQIKTLNKNTKSSNVIDVKKQTSIANSKTKTQQAVKQITNAVKPSTTEEYASFGSQKYIDSEALAKKAYNQTDKKRFFSIPSASSAVDNIELTPEQQLASVAITKKNKDTGNFAISPSYTTVGANQLKNMLGESCVKPKAFKKTPKLTSKKALNLWPRPKSFKNEKGGSLQADFVAVNNNAAFRLLSFSKNDAGTKYYWPLVVFLDQKGCFIQGTLNYYVENTPATWLQKKALKGYVLVPKNAAYLMLTPMAESADLKKQIPDIQLLNHGALTLLGL